MKVLLFGFLSFFLINNAVADPLQPETSTYEDFLFVESILPKPATPSFIDPSFYIGSTGITLGALALSGTSGGGSSYTLPFATTSTPGGVTISTGLLVDGSGHLSVAYGTTSGTSVQGNDARLNSFSGSTVGIVPSPGSSVGYLKSDGTWSTPGGGGISITNGSLTASGSLNIGSGLTLSGTGSSYTLTSTGGGGVSITPGSVVDTTGNTITLPNGSNGTPTLLADGVGNTTVVSGGYENLTLSYIKDGSGTTIPLPVGGRFYPSGLIQAFDFTTATGPGVNDPVSGDSAAIIGWTSDAQSDLGFTTNGSSTYIQMPSTVMGRFTWTVAVRFKTTSNTSGGGYYNDPSVYSVALNGIGNDGGIQIHNGYANFWCSPGTGDVAYTSTVLINDGNFHTIVYTSDMLAYRLYVDGVYTGVQYNGSITLPWGYGKQTYQAPSMGRSGTFDFSGSFQGGLAATFSHMRAWNYKLTDSQIATLDLTQPPQNGP